MARFKNNGAQTLKLFFLLVICYEHIWFNFADSHEVAGAVMRNWWILGDIGLFYFTMSSAYFTAVHYDSAKSMQGYFSRKVSRIGLQFLFINILIFLYCFAAGMDNLFSVHTVINLLGLNGFLNWLHIVNLSPLGAGQWFITVLFIFYFAYPLMLKTCGTRGSATILLVVSAALALLGQWFMPYGHSLWSTCFGFIAGFYFAKAKPDVKPALAVTAVLFAVCCICKITFGGGGVISYTIIALLGLGISLLTLPRDIGFLSLNFLRPLDAVFLPLFLMHTYFFKYAFVTNPYLNSLLVLLFNVVLAKLVSVLYSRLQKKLLA